MGTATSIGTPPIEGSVIAQILDVTRNIKENFEWLFSEVWKAKRDEMQERSYFLVES